LGKRPIEKIRSDAGCKVSIAQGSETASWKTFRKTTILTTKGKKKKSLLWGDKNEETFER